MIDLLRHRLHELRERSNDDGVALMTVILVTALITALTLTVSVIATSKAATTLRSSAVIACSGARFFRWIRAGR